MTQATKTRLVSIFLAFVLGICAVITTAAQTPLVARAESITYSGVMEDLKKDTSFNPGNYPTKADDYSLQIIQLAESSDKELFVYVYQPSGKAKNFKASSINISTTINDSISYLNYKLELLNSNGVFYKYKVKGLTVKDESVRYYAISSIYRPFDESIDKQASGGNTVTEVNYAVNKQYCFGEINGKPYVNCVDIETIVVTDKFVGFVRYHDGFKLYVGACDSHFVAFNTNKPMDKLLEANVYYTTQSYDWSSVPFVGVKETFGDKADKYAYLKYTDKVEHTGGGLFAGTYKWDRIQTIDDFIKGENRENIYHGAVLDVKTSSKLTDEALTELKGKKWVLKLTLVCMGHKSDLAAALKQELSQYKTDIDVVDILHDRSDLQFKRDSEAEITIEGNELVIKNFYPLNLMQKLSLDKETVDEWRQLVESVMIDFNYDGAVMQPKTIDLPDKDKMVVGRYKIPSDAGIIRVKITDVLSESLEVEVQNG